MHNETLATAVGRVEPRSVPRRAVVALAGLAFVIVALVALQHRADAVPVAQFDVAALIRAIVCPILNFFSTGPFASFFGAIFNGLRSAFGCGVVSGP